jgi:hypothetical protein
MADLKNYEPALIAKLNEEKAIKQAIMYENQGS